MQMLTATELYSAVRRFQAAYSAALRPLCAELQMAQNAVDILMYLANNPERSTARDICTYRQLKPGIVSFHVEKLVQEGLLRRESVPGDRRKCRLVCTEKALPLVERGRRAQEDFARRSVEGLSPAELEALSRCLDTIGHNLARMAGEETENG